MKFLNFSFFSSTVNFVDHLRRIPKPTQLIKIWNENSLQTIKNVWVKRSNFSIVVDNLDRSSIIDDKLSSGDDKKE